MHTPRKGGGRLMARRIFRNGSPCPKDNCDGKITKHYNHRWPYNTWLECAKCGEDPNVAWKIVARLKKDEAEQA